MKRLLPPSVLLAALSAGCPPAAPTPLPPDELATEHERHQSLDAKLDGWSDAFKDVALQIVEPRQGAVYETGELSVVFNLQGYYLQDKGPHVHVIVDDQPYVAHYDAGKPFDLKGLAPGAHVVRAFPSRPWHESIKSSPKAFAAVRFVVQADDGRWPVDFGKPLFTFSRPKGEYAGEQARRILIDWYLTGVSLSAAGHKVRWVLDGKESLATEWKPIWLEGLAPGEHTLAMSLVDASGQTVDNGGLGAAERRFAVKP